MDNIINRIYDHYDEFTVSKRAVADYILNSFKYITYDTLSELAEKIEVSTTSIFRFAQDLGYSGYSEMLEAIREYTNLDDPFSANKTFSKIEGAHQSEVFKQTIAQDLDNLKTTMESLSEEDLSEATKLLATSRKVYLAGFNDSFSLSYYMALRLGELRDNVHLLGAVGEMFTKDIVMANEEDVLLAYWFPRYSMTTLNIINWIRKHGGKVIVISSTNYERIKGFGDIILPTAVHGGGVKESLVAPFSLSSYLTSAVALYNGDKTKKYMMETERLLQSGPYLDIY